MANILCSIGTRGRSDSTLAACLQSIIDQTRPPDTLLIIDDNPPGSPSLNEHTVIGGLLRVASLRIKKVSTIRGPGRGPQHNHEFARTCELAKDLIWRVDDDECPEPGVLAALEKELENPEVGAAAGLVLVPWTPRTENPFASNQIEDLMTALNVQCYQYPSGTRFENVGHLHSTYLYRKDAAAYDLNMSSVGHTEETRHTIRIRMNRYRLVVNTDLVTWHYRQPHGGIRSQQGDYQKDETEFRNWAISLPFTYRRVFPIVAQQGVGDCWALYQALPDIMEAAEPYFDTVRLFTKPELLSMWKERLSGRWKNLVVHSIEDVNKFRFSGEFNVYCWWGDAEKKSKWKGNLVTAYRYLYLDRIQRGALQ